MLNSLASMSGAKPTEEGVTVLGARNGLELAIKRRREKSLGRIITQAQSPDLIAGVMIEPLRIFADDRGLFASLHASALQA